MTPPAEPLIGLAVVERHLYAPTQLGIVNDRLMTSTDYCGPDAWFAPRHPQSLHLPNPEIAGGEDELYWLRFAGFYCQKRF